MRYPFLSVAALSAGALSATGAQADVPQVVADIAPVHSLVAKVMQGVGEPTLLVEPGASPHGYALRPSKAAALSQADAVFWIGEKLEPWLEGPLDTLGDGAVAIELLDVSGTTVLEFREGATFAAHNHDTPHGAQDDHDDHGHDDHDDHADDHAHGHEDHAGDDHGHDDHADEHAHEDHGHEDQGHDDHAGHAHDGADPHAWLDPANASVWMAAIAHELSELDPQNAATYAANAAAGQAEMAALIDELRATLEPVHDLHFVVFHDAYHYFENRFGMTAAGAISLGDASDPGAKRIAEVRDAVVEMQVTCVFAEPQFNPGLVQTVAETGTHVATLDPLGTGLTPGAGLYTQLMRDLAQSMLGCQ
ncbi:zinc ABC transporter substrate-binding protein [Thalassobius sp. S69A]|uniref:zinc ABC transporter substrate-binding protein n=1 Tax=unclassified Thalassovita TaxID=2619711 RepID=UPI003C7C24A4